MDMYVLTLPVSSMKMFSLERSFSFTDCKMAFIGCNLFRNIYHQFPEMVRSDFGNELCCEYISRSFEWVDSLKVNVVGQLKGRSGLDSLESHRLKRPSGLDFAKFWQCRAIFQVEYCNSVLGSLMKGVEMSILLGLRVMVAKVSWLC